MVVDASMSVDADEVRRVVAFYRDAAEIVGAAAEEIRAHELGTWAVGGHYRELGERYREMGVVIADRLGEQARAADRLSDALAQGMSVLVDADEETV